MCTLESWSHLVTFPHSVTKTGLFRYIQQLPRYVGLSRQQHKNLDVHQSESDENSRSREFPFLGIPVRINLIFSRSTLRNHFQFLVCFSKHKMKIKNFPFSSRVTRCWKKFLISSRKTRFSCIFLIVFFCQWFRNSLKCIDPFNTFRCPWLYEIHSEAFNTHKFSYIPPHT